jgi:arylformamidase
MSVLYDISPKLSPKTAVFTGDTPLSQEVLLHFNKGHNLVLSTLKSTVHLGAHADAPIHYHPQGADIASRSLAPYLGRAQVIEVKVARGARIGVADVRVDVGARRVLFKTGSFADPNTWHDDFVSLSPELIDWLAKKNVTLVGIDTPSVDPATDKTLVSHAAIFKNDLSILEGLELSQVPAGFYELIALPLRLEGFDASPVRAVLRSDCGHD